jgi:hypothetical protein
MADPNKPAAASGGMQSSAAPKPPQGTPPGQPQKTPPPAADVSKPGPPAGTKPPTAPNASQEPPTPNEGAANATPDATSAEKPQTDDKEKQTGPTDLLTDEEQAKLGATEGELQKKETVNEFFERHGFEKIEAPDSAGDVDPAHNFVVVLGFKKDEVRAYRVVTKIDLMNAKAYLAKSESKGKLIGWYEVPQSLLQRVTVASYFNATDSTS